MNHQAQVPEPFASYFLQFGVTEHPVIAQTFRPRVGWRDFPIRKRISGAEVRRLRSAGHTWFRLDAGGHQADFQLNESFTEYVGLGPVFTYGPR